MKYWIYISTICLLIIGCKKPMDRTCFKSNGATSIRTINDIHASKIELNDDISMVLMNDSLNFVEIVGPENLLQQVSIIATDNIIKISNLNKCKFLRKLKPITITYHYSDLTEIVLNGFGRLKNKDTVLHPLSIKANNAYADIELVINSNQLDLAAQQGSVNAIFSGFCDQLYIYSNGSGIMDARNLVCKSVHGHSQGIGDFHLNGTEHIRVELRGKGDFYLYGIGNKSIDITGSGNVLE